MEEEMHICTILHFFNVIIAILIVCLRCAMCTAISRGAHLPTVSG